MANNLKALRRRAKLTQPQLAELMGTTKNQLVKLEQGSRRLDQQWIERAAAEKRWLPGWVVSQFEIRLG